MATGEEVLTKEYMEALSEEQSDTWLKEEIDDFKQKMEADDVSSEEAFLELFFIVNRLHEYIGQDDTNDVSGNYVRRRFQDISKDYRDMMSYGDVAIITMYNILWTLYVRNEMREKAEEAQRTLLYYQLKYAPNNDDYNGLVCYSFYPIGDHYIEDLLKYQISLSAPSTFNDPVDCPVFTWMERLKNLENPILAESSITAYSNVRIRCFAVNSSSHLQDDSNKDLETLISEPCNTLMWAHYADKHKGYCVKYKLSKAFFDVMNNDHSVLFGDKVEYKSDMSALNNRITLKEAFFTKHKSWEYEQEWRLLYFDKDETSDRYHKVPMLDGMITDIYFGVNCKESDKLRIIEALKGRTVKYHRMEVDPEHLYRLKEVPIDPSTYER